jgi:hypothetical protein
LWNLKSERGANGKLCCSDECFIVQRCEAILLYRLSDSLHVIVKLAISLSGVYAGMNILPNSAYTIVRMQVVCRQLSKNKTLVSLELTHEYNLRKMSLPCKAEI